MEKYPPPPATGSSEPGAHELFSKRLSEDLMKTMLEKYGRGILKSDPER